MGKKERGRQETRAGAARQTLSGQQNEAKRFWPGAVSQAVRAVRQDTTTTPEEFCEPLLTGGCSQRGMNGSQELLQLFQLEGLE